MVRLLFLFGLNEADLDKLLDEWNAKLPEDMCDLILEAQAEVMLKKPRGGGASKRKSNGIKKGRGSTSDEDYDYMPDDAVEVKLVEESPVKRRKKVTSGGPPRKSTTTTTTTQACFLAIFQPIV